MNRSQLKRRPRIFLLTSGPKYDLQDSFELRLTLLSEQFEGLVLTSSGAAETLQIGNFVVIALRFPGKRGFAHRLAFASAATRIVLEERIAGRSPDLIVTYDPLLTGLVGVLIAPLAASKLVTEVNGDYTAPANHWDERSGKVREARRQLYMAIERFVLKRSNGIKLLYETQVDKFMPLKAEIAAFPGFVNLYPFGNLEEQKVILSVGFPFYVKGMDVLISAFKSITDKHPDWQLKILGWYPDLSVLESHIGGHPRISHHPPVLWAQMPEHIGRCGIFVLCSRTEAMGRVLLEAMAAGKPRIGTRVGGIPTVISDGKDGLLVEPEDETGLATQLDRLMGDHELRRKLGEAGAKRARTEFGVSQYFARLTRLYMHVLGIASSEEAVN